MRKDYGAAMENKANTLHVLKKYDEALDLYDQAIKTVKNYYKVWNNKGLLLHSLGHLKNKKYFNDERIVFNLCGKFEKRKHHAKIIKSWIKKYGNNPKYSLQCAVYNPFLNEEQNQQILNQEENIMMILILYFNLKAMSYIELIIVHKNFVLKIQILCYSYHSKICFRLAGLS